MTRAELRMRLIASLVCMVVIAGLWAAGVLPEGPGRIELLIVAGAFFGVSAVRSYVRLKRLPEE